MIEAVILDMDGTLVDPAEGVIAAYQYTLEQLGLEVPAWEQLLWVIGPPTRQNLAALLNGKGDLERALSCFRAFYGVEGRRRIRSYGGICRVLRLMRGLSVRLFVCTARPRRSAEQILQHLGLVSYLDSIYGAEEDGRFEDKAELLGLLLTREQVSPQCAVMVGDRASDIAAATVHGVRAIAASWGYGTREEVAASGALAVCDDPGDLVFMIRRIGAGSREHHDRSRASATHRYVDVGGQAR